MLSRLGRHLKFFAAGAVGAAAWAFYLNWPAGPADWACVGAAALAGGLALLAAGLLDEL